MNSKVIRTLFLVVFLFTATSCVQQPEIAVIKTPSPAMAIQTSTPTIAPTETLPTSTPVPNGLVDPNSIEEYYYTNLIKVSYFPFVDINTLPKELKNMAQKMYKDHKFLDEGGIEIYTPNNETIRISSSISDKETKLSIYKDDIETAVITTHPGELIYFRTKVDPESQASPEDVEGDLLWCLYSPDDNTCVDIEVNFEKSITTMPSGGHQVFFDETWLPFVDSNYDTTLFWSIPNIADDIKKDIIASKGDIPEEELNRIYSTMFTYRLVNNKIYSYGPPPMVLPSIKIKYPKTTVLWEGYKLELGKCPFPIEESLGDPKENGCTKILEEYFATPFGPMTFVDVTYCAVFDKYGNLIDVDTTPEYGRIHCYIEEP